MEHPSDIITKASAFVAALFEDRLSKDLVYHTYEHTRSVAETAWKIGKGMKLGEEGIEVVTLAGWLHDTGYTEIYAGHEEVSIRIATEFLQQEHYPEDKIRLICGCIRATKIPQRPQHLLEEIVADADLAGLGRRSFFDQSDLLHVEWGKSLNKFNTEAEWTRQNIELLSSHTFFTSFAKETYGPRQDQNLATLRKILLKLDSKASFKSADKKRNQTSESRSSGLQIPENNSEMIFKQSQNTLMMESLSVDHKALTLILSNAVLLCFGLIGLVATKMWGGHGMTLHLVFACFSLVSGLAIIFAVRALRQKNPSDEAEEPKTNSPLFGDFSARRGGSYDEFLGERIKEKNPPRRENDILFFSSMTRDYFDERLLVARKYDYIRLSYATFMYGICLTVLISLILLFMH